MKELRLLILFILILTCIAQQNYSGESVFDCDDINQSTPATPSSSYLYTCNAQPSCQTFLIFKAQPRYTTVSTITRLFSSDPSLFSQINGISKSSTLPTDKEVIVPITCSCSGQYYQANASFPLTANNDYFQIANDVYQSLTTCKALMGENPYDQHQLPVGQPLKVPLRCACPTNKQVAEEITYLMTYSISENESIPDISDRFNVSREDTVFANGFSEPDPLVYYSTTLLIPMRRPPSISDLTTKFPFQYPPPPPLTHGNSLTRRSKRGIYAGIGAGAGTLLLLCFVVLAILWHRRKRMRVAVKTELNAKPKASKYILEEIAGADHILKVFEFEELKVATSGFSMQSRIEGSVYRGVIRGTLLAIKEMNADVTTEVNILHKVNHFNLIGLHGVSLGEESCYLVYEYMENGSLEKWVHDDEHSAIWSWTQRVQIALDVANGLDYLHNFTELPYVHKNISSGNILLNGKLRAKIANFSIARSSEKRGVGFSATGKVVGTLGYMAPEYLEAGVVTTKLDVYAFGVVIAELVTGKHAVIKVAGEERLLSSALMAIVKGGNEDEMREFMEDGVREKCEMSHVMGMARLSVACMEQDREKRPSMVEVIPVLAKIMRDSQIWETGAQDES